MTDTLEGGSCYHCGLPVPPGTDLSVTIKGADRAMCCPGCQAVAQTIVGIGMESYYDHRERCAPGAIPSAEIVPAFLGTLQDWDDPALQESFVHTNSDAHQEITLMINGITCSACVWLIEHHLKAQPGIVQCQLNMSSHRARVVWDPQQTSLSAIIRAIAQVGYKAEPYTPAQQEEAIRKESQQA